MLAFSIDKHTHNILLPNHHSRNSFDKENFWTNSTRLSSSREPYILNFVSDNTPFS